MKGKFITLEGVEGSGKSTQAKLIGEYLQESGYEVIMTYEPGNTQVGDEIRSILLSPDYNSLENKTELLLYVANRAQHVAEVIKPALKRGKIVICDRYIDASVAYQGYGRGIKIDLVTTLNQIATNSLVPDLTLLLDIDPVFSLQRANEVTASEGGEDRIESEKLSFHRRVREGYLKLAEKEERIKIIDAGQSVKEVFASIKSLLKQRWLKNEDRKQD